MAPTSWSVPGNVTLKWREWDGDYVVFNPASGDTHFLNAVAGAVLKLVESAPASLDEIVAFFEDVSESPVEPDLAKRIRDLVDNLDAVGLIEPVER